MVGLLSEPVLPAALSFAQTVSISGRVVPDAGDSVPSPIGLRVGASSPVSEPPPVRPMTANVANDWLFRMSGAPGSYQFTVSSDRPPLLVVTRISVDGIETPASAPVTLASGSHHVVVFVAPRPPPPPSAESSLTTRELVERFKGETFFWRQIAIGKEIVQRRDASVIPPLEGWLGHQDRHVRGNVAFVLAGLGDRRGLQAIEEILADRSDRPEGQGIATASSDGRFHVARQIAADRYYAVHLLGELRDPQGVPILLPLLKDAEVNSAVPRALGEIRDKRAVAPLLDALDDDSPSMRVLVIYALESLGAREAVPRLTALLNDQRRSNFGAQVSVADAAKVAIAKLQ
jgi:hypothetical protein